MKVDNCSCLVGGRVVTSTSSKATNKKSKSKSKGVSSLQFGKLKKTDDERVTEFLEQKKKDLEKHEASKALDSMKHPDIETLVGSIKYGTVLGSQQFPSMSKGTRSNYVIVIEYLPRDSNVDYRLVEYSYVDRKSKDHVNLNVRFVDDEYKGVHKSIYDAVFKKISGLGDAVTSVTVSADEMKALETLKLVRQREDGKGATSNQLDYTNVAAGAAPDVRYGYFNLARGSHEVVITSKSQLKLNVTKGKASARGASPVLAPMAPPNEGLGELKEVSKNKKARVAPPNYGPGNLEEIDAPRDYLARFAPPNRVPVVSDLPRNNRARIAPPSYGPNIMDEGPIERPARIAPPNYGPNIVDEDPVERLARPARISPPSYGPNIVDEAPPRIQIEVDIVPRDLEEEFEEVIDDDGAPVMAAELDQVIALLKSGEPGVVSSWRSFCNKYDVSISLKYYMPATSSSGIKRVVYYLNDPVYGDALPIYIPFKGGKYLEYAKKTYTMAFNQFNKDGKLSATSYNVFNKLGLIYKDSDGGRTEYVHFYNLLSTNPDIQVQYETKDEQSIAFRSNPVPVLTGQRSSP